MTEYIKKSDAINAITKSPSRMAVFTAKALNAIEILPAADVVEVVRCKDCKHFKEGDPVFLRTPDTCWYFSGYDDVEVKPDGFCSYGERKEQT